MGYNTQPMPIQQPKKNSSESPIIIDSTTLELNIAWDKVAPLYKKTVAKLASKIKLDGFRLGKAPLHLAKDNLDQQYLTQEVLNQLLPSIYADLIKKNNLKPISDPEFEPVQLDEGKEWRLKVRVAEKPSVSIKNYREVVKKARAEAKKTLADQAKNKQPEKKVPTQTEENSIILQTIYRNLVTQFRPQVPELLLKQETRSELQHLAERIEKSGISLDTFLSKTNQSFEKLSNDTAIAVLGRIQLGFILGEVAKEEKIEVSQAELRASLQNQPEAHRDHQHLINAVHAQLMQQKIAEHLLKI